MSVYHLLQPLLGVLGCLAVMATGDPASSSGYRLPNTMRYLALAPKTVRADTNYQVYVTLYSDPPVELKVKATLSRDGEEYASGEATFLHKGSKHIQVKIPEVIHPGTHRLLIEGLVNQQPVFENSTVLQFHSKHASLFIQTDRPVYAADSTVLFKILGTTPGLKPMHGTMTIYVKDGNGITVRRWLQKQLNFGYYEDSFEIPYPVNVGNWSIVVHAFGHIYRHEFLVKFWYLRRFDVIVDAPLKVFDTEWGIVGTVRAEHTSNKMVDGNGRIELMVRDNGTFLEGKLNRKLTYITTFAAYDFSMKSIEAEFGDVTGKELYLKAWVTDFYWNETQNGTAVTHVYKDSIRLKVLGTRFRSFKPGAAFTVIFVVDKPDGTPYTGLNNRHIVVQRSHEGDVSVVEPEDKVFIPDDSIVRYTVVPRAEDRKITIRAWHDVVQQTVEIECYRYWSEKDRFITVTTSTRTPKVNEYAIFTVRTNFLIDEVNYLIMGQGQILTGSTLGMRSRQKTFSLAVSRDMAPTARMVVYCMVGGEVLTDALTFHVNDTSLYEAELLINHGKNFRGDQKEIIGRGHQGGFISVHGQERRLYLRGGNTFLNDEKVTKDLLEYNYGGDVDDAHHHIWSFDDDRWQGSVFFNNPTTGVDHMTTFNVSGLVALSDTNLTVTPESTHCNATLGFGRCLTGECFDLRYRCDGKVDCTQDAVDEIACPNAPPPGDRPYRLDDLHLIRKDFVDTHWIWQKEYIKAVGQTEISVIVPNINTEFMVGAYIVHPEDGLAIVNTPIRESLTRSFWMSVEAPTSLLRGEQIGIRCAVFNEWHEDIEAIMTLHGGENYRFVVVEEFGIVSSYAPRTIAGDIQIMVYIEARSSKYVLFPVVPTIGRGSIEVKISAHSVLRSDSVVINIDVDYDGTINDDHIPYLIDLVNQGSIIIPDFDIPMPERFFNPGQRELIYIPGSNWLEIYIFGNVVQPGFFEEPLNTENTVRVPWDSADGYLYDFAMNLQTMKYLRTTSALDVDQQFRVLEHMKTFLARLFAYMQPDGSFKMFRRTESPCLWLTSIVLRHLHNAHVSEWNEYLAIELDLLNQMGLWIADQFNYDSGRFEETAEHFYDRNMGPSTTDAEGNEVHWHIPVTSHVVITLSIATWMTGEAGAKTREVRDLACEYLSTKIYEVTDPYQMAILAYALHTADFKTKDDAYYRLKTMRRETEFVYWAKDPVGPNPVQIVERRILMQPRDDHVNQGVAVLGTSYALLMYLDHNELEASVPIMKWLQTQRADYLVASSTQDMLIFFQALQEYAYRETNRAFYKMEITLEATQQQDPPWRHVIQLNSSNFAEQFVLEMENAWGEIRVSAKGTGYAFLHMTTYHNVEKPWQVLGPEYDPQAFLYSMDQIYAHGRNGSKVNFTVCLSWNRLDQGQQSGMVLYMMAIPTGYVISRDVIEWMYTAGIPGLMRVRFRDQTLIIFLEYLTYEGMCFESMMERWYPVANTSIAHLVNILEYSEAGVHYNTMYETYSLFHLHICQVCGSFQCPYCPWYNTASPTAQWGTTALGLILALVLCKLLTCISIETANGYR